MELPLIIGLVGLAATVASFFVGRTTAAKKDGQDDGERKAKIEAMEKEVHGLRVKVEGMIANVADKNARVEALEREVSCLWKEIEPFKPQLGALQRDVAVMDSHLSSMKATLEAVATDVRSLLFHARPPGDATPVRGTSRPA